MTNKADDNSTNRDLVPNEIDKLAKDIEKYSSSWLDNKAGEEKDDFALVTEGITPIDVNAEPFVSSNNDQSENLSQVSSESLKSKDLDAEIQNLRKASFEQTEKEADRIEELAQKLAEKGKGSAPKKHQNFMSEEEARDRETRSKDRILIPKVHQEDSKKNKKKSSENTKTSGDSLIPRLAKGKDSFAKKNGGSPIKFIAAWTLGLSYIALLASAIYGHGNQAVDEAYEALSTYGLEVPDFRDYEFVNPFSTPKIVPASFEESPAVIFVSENLEIEPDAPTTEMGAIQDLSVAPDNLNTGVEAINVESAAPTATSPTNNFGGEAEASPVPVLDLNVSRIEEKKAIPDLSQQLDAPQNPSDKINGKPQTLVCRSWQDLSTSSADKLASSLNGMRIKYVRTERDQPKFFVVAIDPKRAPEGYTQSLAKNGVAEVFRIKDEGPLQNFVSLGQFKFKSSAEKHKINLERQGVSHLVISGHKVTKLTSIKAKMSPEQAFNVPADLRKISGQSC